MCQRIPFHPNANANSDDLKAWAEMYLEMAPEIQSEQTDDIRRTIVLANMKRNAGITTRTTRPNIRPQMDAEVAD